MFEELAITSERIQAILQNKSFQKCLKKNEEAEVARKFCHHDMVHFLDVARIAIILNEKEQQGVADEFIYAAALLHDIGRFQQYKDNTPHEKASAQLAPKILKKCGFLPEEIEHIVDAILSHRDREAKDSMGLRGLLYRADKLSRPCFACKAKRGCNWKADKKNLTLKI